MEQPQVGPNGKGVGSTESNYSDEHGYEEMSTDAFAARMGQGKNKNSASRLTRFLLFFCQSQLAGIICLALALLAAPFGPSSMCLLAHGHKALGYAHLGNLIRCAHPFGAACGTLSRSTRLWLVPLQPCSARSLLKTGSK